MAMQCHGSSMMRNDSLSCTLMLGRIRHATHRSNPQGICSPQLLHSMTPGIMCSEALL